MGDGPYRQSYGFDEWDNQLSRVGRYWGDADTDSETFTPATGRNPQWTYDADGRLLTRNEPSPNDLAYAPAQFTYDASGRPSQTAQTTSRVVPAGGVSTTAVTAAESYDGDGAEVRRDTTKRVGGGQPSVQTTYYLRSSVLGGRLVTEYDSAGVRRNSYIPWGAGVVAEQLNADTASPQLLWRQANPVTGDGRDTDSSGRLLAASHLDPEGADAGESAPQSDPSDNEVADHGKVGAGIELLSAGVSGLGQCTLNGWQINCAMAQHLIDVGAAQQCPNNDCGVQAVEGTLRVNGRVVARNTRLASPKELAAFGGGTYLRYTTTGGWAVGRAAQVYSKFFAGEGGLPTGAGELEALGLRMSAGGDPYSQYTQIASLNGVPQNTGKRVPLSGSYAEMFNYQRKYLLSLLADPDSDCAKFLKKTFGFNASRVAEAVRAIRAYDADASTISMGAAGLTPYHDPDTGKSNPTAGVPVNEYFDAERHIGNFIGAKQAGYSMRTMRDIYFSGRNELPYAQEILHETLHMFKEVMMQRSLVSWGLPWKAGTRVVSQTH